MFLWYRYTVVSLYSHPLPMSSSISAPSHYEDLLTPRLYATDLPKAARNNLSEQRQCFEAMLQEMERDDNSDHFDRKANLGRLTQLTPSRGRPTEVTWFALAYPNVQDSSAARNSHDDWRQRGETSAVGSSSTGHCWQREWRSISPLSAPEKRSLGFR